jgi:hypothetical protein
MCLTRSWAVRQSKQVDHTIPTVGKQDKPNIGHFVAQPNKGTWKIALSLVPPRTRNTIDSENAQMQ